MDAEQRTDEWFAARLGKATASRFADILARTPAPRNNYRAQLVLERLTGIKQDSYTNGSMQWGVEQEPTAKLAYTAETGNEVIDAPFIEHDLLAAGASPDGFIGNDGLIEIKCPNSATHIDTLHKGKLPAQYLAQVQGQLWITGRQWCDFVSFDPRLPLNAQLFVVRAERDETYLANLEAEVSKFLEEVDKEVEFLQAYSLSE